MAYLVIANSCIQTFIYIYTYIYIYIQYIYTIDIYIYIIYIYIYIYMLLLYRYILKNLAPVIMEIIFLDFLMLIFFSPQMK